jgi:hypothetical protein
MEGEGAYMWDAVDSLGSLGAGLLPRSLRTG